MLSSGLDLLICFYFKVMENFIHLIFSDRFWFSNIPSVSKVKHYTLGDFLVNHLSYTVMPNYLTTESFILVVTAVFYWRLSDSNSSQLFRSLLNILGNFSSGEVWIVSIPLEIFSSLSLFPRFYRIVPRVKTITGITVSFIII